MDHRYLWGEGMTLKPEHKFTEAQIKYLKDCLESAYGRRWTIGKDHFDGAYEVLRFLTRCNSEDKDFDTELRQLNMEDEGYPF